MFPLSVLVLLLVLAWVFLVLAIWRSDRVPLWIAVLLILLAQSVGVLVR